MLENVRRFTVSKGAITRLFVISTAFLVAGWVFGVIVVVTAIANGAVTFGGAQPVTVNPGPFAGAVAGMAVASLVTAIGGIGAFASWAAALRNTWNLDDKSWFVGLLSLGLVSFGWLAVVAYVLRGPDATGPAPKAA